MYTLVSNLSQERGHPSQLWGFSDIRFSLQNHWDASIACATGVRTLKGVPLDGDPYETIQMVSCSSRCLTNLRHTLRVRALVLGGSLDALDALLNDLG